MAEQVIIEFISDTSQLTPAIDQLEKMGKVEKAQGDQFKATNTEIQKQVKTLDQLAATTSKIGQAGIPLKKTIIDLNTQVKGLSQTFMKDFQQGAAEALKQAGVSAAEFEDALSKATGETTSLKSQLREMIAALAKMKVSGQDNSAQYQELAQKAGQLKDAIADANQEVKNFGSDTSTLDGVLSLTGGIAGGFAAVQGAAALFGDESEELQKTLLRVNAAMAILQGFQQIQIVLQKESAAATLANTIATKAQTVAQVVYNFVVGSSVGLLKALRIALAATGIGLFVLAIVALVQAFKSSNNEMEDANKLIEHQKNLLDSLNEAIDRNLKIQEARAKAAGALESEILKIQGRSILAQIDNLVELNAELAKQLDNLDNTSEAYFTLNKQLEANNDAIKKLNADAGIKAIEVEKQLADERLKSIADSFSAQLAGLKKNSKEELEVKKLLVKSERDVSLQAAGQNEAERRKIIAESNKKIRDLNREFQVVLQNDRIAAIEASLSQEVTRARAIGERTTQAEIDLQKKLVQEKADLELLQEGLTANQILEIKTTSINEQLKLQRDFNKQTQKEALEDLISRNNKELEQIEIGDAKKLSLTIENIMTAARIEADANQGNSDKIKEINTKRDADIRAARIASIQAIAEYEIQITTARSGVLLRGIEAELSAQDKIRNTFNAADRKRVEKETGFKRSSVQEQIRLIDILTSYEAGKIAKRIDALNEERAKGLISQQDYNLQYEQLVDEQTKVYEDGEKRKTAVTISESEKRRQATINSINTILDVASQVSGVLDSLSQLTATNENNALERRKAQLEELRQAGAITEKEAQARAKRIEADERKIRRQQAEREKNIALFNAAIAIPQAVLKGLTTGGPILAAVYGAIAAAQLLIVASRPIPKFGKGKKGSYEGPAEVGETGAELIQSNGRMYVADKPQVVWLGKQDKVYNPQETIDMLSKGSVNTERLVIPAASNGGMKIDYDKFGKSVAKHVKTDVYVDGIHAQHKEKELFEKYLDGRRGFK